VGGPVKAVELSDKINTASVYALNNNIPKELAYGFSTSYYPISVTNDIAGVEVSSAFKNVYAVSIGICDGLFKFTREGMYHNFNAFLFNQAMIEISKIAQKAGGRKETVFDLAGIGDFYVASISGRNRRYGEYVGTGENPQKIFEKMFNDGEVAEGYFALKIGLEWVKSLGGELINEVPLLKSLYKIIFEGHKPLDELKDFTEDMRTRYKSSGLNT
jgi:glycerol-3-phosphate dehydrogenase (NAD(P)+)